MVADSSAIIAVLHLEPNAAEIAARFAQAEQVVISAPTWVEVNVVMLRRHGDGGELRLKEFEAIAKMTIKDFDPSQAEIAIEAYRRYGRGSGSPAKLNLGDCFSYALAKSLDAPLLFVGGDFMHTDVKSAMAPS